MAKHLRLNNLFWECGLILSALGIHLWYLSKTTFVDWPEMLLYPWFLSQGMLYYRDVVLAYVPGAYYFLHAFYSVIGYSAQSERAIAYGFILLTDVLVYATARKLTRSWLAGIFALFFFILWQPIFSGNTIWYETILAPMYLGAYLLVLRYGARPTIGSVLPVGLVLASATLIKQTAAWPLLAVCVFIWLSAKKKKQGFIHAVVVGLIAVGGQLMSWGYYALLGAGSEYAFWVFGFIGNLSQSASMYALAPPRSDITLILPAVIPLFLLILLRPKKEGWLLVIFTISVLLAGLPRWGLHRLQPMLAFIAVAGALAGSSLLQKKRFVVVGIVALCLLAAGSWRSYRVFMTLRDPMQPTFFGKDYEHLLRYLGANAPDSLYVLGNYDYVYFGRNEKPTVLPWVPLFPWNGKVEGMEERLIASIEDSKVPFILFVPFHPESGYYDGYAPEALFLYVRAKYEKIGAAPVSGGELLRRK